MEPNKPIVRASGEMATRSMPIKPASFNEKDNSFEGIITTEQPALIFDWNRWDYVNEVLRMDGMVIPPNNQIPLLDCHDRSSVMKQFGSIRDIHVENDQAVGRCFFSDDEDSKKAMAKVTGGHLTDLSAGYEQLESYWIPENEKSMINGKEYAGPMLVTTKWALKEASLTPIGADNRAKVRSLSGNKAFMDRLVELGMKEDATEEDAAKFFNEILNKKTDDVGGGGSPKNTPQPSKESIQMEQKKEPTPEETARQEALQAADRARVEGIETIQKKYGNRFKGGQRALDQLALDAVQLNIPLDQFRGSVFTNLTDDDPVETPASALGLSPKEIDRYSVRKGLVSLLRRHNKFDGKDARGEIIDCGFEDECNRELSKRLSADHGGLVLPWEIQTKAMIPDRMQKRVLTDGTVGNGGYLTGTTLSSFIDILRNKPIAVQAGVQQIYGLVGDVAFPRQLTDPTISDIAENTQHSGESTATFDRVTLAPNMATAYMDASIQLLRQSTPSVDGIIMRSLSKKALLKIDYNTIHGAGGDAPTGILATSGIGDVVAANWTRDTSLEFESDIRAANGEVGTINFVINPTDLSILKGRPEQLGYPKYLASDDDKILNYPVLYTNQITAGYAVFGAWSEAILGYWGGLEITLDSITQLLYGNHRFVLYVMYDFGVLHPGAFSACDDLS